MVIFIVKAKRRIEVQDDDLEVQVLSDSNQPDIGKDGKFIKNKWILDNSSNKGDQLENLQSKHSENKTPKERHKKKKRISSAVKVNDTPDRSKPFETPIENLSVRRHNESNNETQEVRLDFDKDTGYEDDLQNNPLLIENNYIDFKLSKKNKINTQKQFMENHVTTLRKNPDASNHFISQESLKIEDMNTSEINNKPYGKDLSIVDNLEPTSAKIITPEVALSSIKIKKKKKKVRKIVRNFGNFTF
jgi:hypothetical protein